MIVSLYIAMSLDGFIADKNGEVGWLDSVNQDANTNDGYGREDHEAYINSIDAVVIGKTTYIQMVGFGDLPYKDKTTYVIGSEAVKSNHQNVVFVKTLDEFLLKIKEENIQKLWLLGGVKLINSFLSRDLIDEYIITVVPVTLNEGIKLPETIISQIDNQYLDKTYPNHVLQYKFNRIKQ